MTLPTLDELAGKPIHLLTPDEVNRLNMQLLYHMLQRLDAMETLALQSPWAFPVSDKWTLYADGIDLRTLKPKEELMFVDIKTKGWLHSYVLITTSPKVRAHINLYQPMGTVAVVSITAEMLKSFNFTVPPANASPYTPLYDTVRNMYGIYVTPPFPGEAFTGRIVGKLINEDVMPIVIIYSRWNVLEIRD